MDKISRTALLFAGIILAGVSVEATTDGDENTTDKKSVQPTASVGAATDGVEASTSKKGVQSIGRGKFARGWRAFSANQTLKTPEEKAAKQSRLEGFKNVLREAHAKNPSGYLAPMPPLTDEQREVLKRENYGKPRMSESFYSEDFHKALLKFLDETPPELMRSGGRPVKMSEEQRKAFLDAQKFINKALAEDGASDEELYDDETLYGAPKKPEGK